MVDNVSYNDVEDLQEMVKHLESELSEYKRCCVLGGDGKPILPGDPIKIKVMGKWIERTVESIRKEDNGKFYIWDGSKFRWAKDCFRTSDAVPTEGVEE